jgi:siroheme synthase-like protein
VSDHFPVNLVLRERSCLVVGAGRVALRKTEQLLVAGASVTVVAPSVVGGFDDLPVEVIRREFAVADLDGRRLVITATGDRVVDQMIFDECERRGIWINSADDPQRCSFTLPATIRRGDLLVTFSTAGSSPGLSSWLRRRFEGLIDERFAAVVDDLAAERRRIHELGESTENLDWTPLIERALVRHGVNLPEEMEVGS